MKDSADPLAGWSYPDVISTPTGPATNDLYGKLHAYIGQRLTAFQQRLRSQSFKFVFTHVDATILSSRCQVRFSRIEVRAYTCQEPAARCFLLSEVDHQQTSNIADGGYLGVQRTASSLGCLLDCPEENPYATLLCLFLNAVDEMEREIDDQARQIRDLKSAMRFFAADRKPQSMYGPKHILSTAAKDYVRDGDFYFDR